MSMDIVVTGVTGQLGHELARRLPPGSRLIALDRKALALEDTGAVAATLRAIRPAIVMNAAAYTAVDRAESEPDTAHRVNAQAPAAIAQACRELGSALVHFSTDYVFDGRKEGRYLETDEPNPLNVYGASKRAGEQAVLASGAAALVLRTTWVYGDHGGNFLKTMLRLATQRTRLQVVADQRGAPTWAGRLADAVLHVLQAALAQPDPIAWLADRGGLYHACAGGETTWHEYAQTVIATAATIPSFAARLRMRAEDVEPIASSAYPTPATRPLNSLLDTTRFEHVFGYRFPDWRGDVLDCVRRVAPTLA